MNLFVQILTKRAQKVSKNTDGDSKRIFGLATSSVLTDRAGSAPSSYLDGSGEADFCLVVSEKGLESMEVPGEGQRDGPEQEKKLEIDELHKVVLPIQSSVLVLQAPSPVTRVVMASLGTILFALESN